nr:reverse transcriptase domain-containing protein [Tanacetum cinerariifolium]
MKSSREEDDLSQPWVCEEIDPFTPRIRYFDFPKTRMPSHIKTYDGRNARVWFDDLPTESIDSYDDLKKVFLENYLQQKKCIKDLIELHNIKQRDGEITNPEFIKRLHDKIPKTMDEMMRVTTSFLRGEVAASNHERNKSFPPWKQQEGNQKQNFRKGSFWNQQRPERKQDRFTLLTKTPKEIFALEKEKFTAPPPMTTPVEKRNHSKFCEFYGEVGHNTDECMHLKKQIEEMLKERMARQKITQSFSPDTKILFPPLNEEEGTEGPMIIEAEIEGHCIHRVYVDGESASKILYEHCFNRIHPKIKNQLVPATTPLIGFSGEIICPIGQIQLLARSQEVLSSSVNGSRNAKNTGRRRNNYPKKKQAGFVGMYAGFRTRKDFPGPQTNSGRKNQGGNKHRISKTNNMTGVPRHIVEYRLNIQEGCPPVRQKKRGQAANRNQAILEEVRKLVEAGIMKEVHYHDWLSNSIMVKKHDGSWRMCVDFKDLNKACPKGGYLLPEIDWKVESLCGFAFKCFLDAYKGNHHIQMAKEDEEKTTFITSQGIFCYTKMPFVLRNAGATYQRLVDKAFHKQIGKNLEVGLSGYSDENGRTPRTMDLVYGRIILYRWFWGRTNSYKPRRDGIHLCSKIQANVDSRLKGKVKEILKKDKIESKPDKNEKRGEAGKSQKQLQWIEEEKLKKMQKEGPEVQTPTSLLEERRREGLNLQFNQRSKRGAQAAS